MKKLLMIAAVAAMTFSMNSCKKGPNDPAISLKSRDGRIVGIWKLASSESTETYKGEEYDWFNDEWVDVTRTETSSYNGTILTTTETVNDNDPETDSYSYSYTVDIRKDGTYEATSIIDGSTSVTTGYWFWVDSKKNKVRIAFDDDANSMYIDMLKNKEMVMMMDYSSTYTDEDGRVTTSTESGTSTFQKQ
ncbi:MAG: hypothetical protein ACLGGV_09670 [Bacteroidia bacterium]